MLYLHIFKSIIIIKSNAIQRVFFLIQFLPRCYILIHKMFYIMLYVFLFFLCGHADCMKTRSFFPFFNVLNCFGWSSAGEY